MKRAESPNSLVLIFALIVVAQIATYFLPAGEYERETRPEAAAWAEVVTIPEGAVLEGPEAQTVVLPADRRIVLPAGTTREVPGRRVRAGTYRQVDGDPLPWHAFLTSIPVGMQRAADIIFFVLIVGG